MSNLNTLDFAPLDTTGIGYHKWVRDVLNHLKAQGIISAIREPVAATSLLAAAGDAVTATTATQAARITADTLEAKNVKTIITMIRHMDEYLQFEYLNEENPKRLWVALEEWFGNFRESLLPDPEVKWLNLHFCDFFSILNFNSKSLRIRSLMEFCHKQITNAMLIDKTLYLFRL